MTGLRWVAVVALAAGFVVAGCSSSPAVNLKQDQMNVAIDSGRVASDQLTLQTVLKATFDCNPPATTGGCPRPSVSGLRAQLKTDELKLKVAKDQLSKDESSG